MTVIDECPVHLRVGSERRSLHCVVGSVLVQCLSITSVIGISYYTYITNTSWTNGNIYRIIRADWLPDTSQKLLHGNILLTLTM